MPKDQQFVHTASDDRQFINFGLSQMTWERLSQKCFACPVLSIVSYFFWMCKVIFLDFHTNLV
jgi:hypothetical protein